MKVNTIKKNEDYRLIYNKGQSIAGAFLVMYRIEKSSEQMRFGITVSKKVGNAVKRNRVRRLIKESIRLNLTKFNNQYDYVFIARVRANSAKLIDIEKNIRYLLAMFRKNRK